MRSKHDPTQSILDIIENAARIAGYVAGLRREEFVTDGRTRDAAERCLERICEAAHRLGDQAPRLMPDQPWADIRGMGNRLRHGYDRIDMQVLWNAVTVEVPALENAARIALATIDDHPI